MNLNITCRFCALAILCLFAFAAEARAADLVGQPAPPLAIAEWIKGEPAQLADGKVHVIEFWATWCGPCRQSIPHLTELQRLKESEGVVIVGVSTEKPEVVRPFVESAGPRMGYRVAVDRDQKTWEAWMEAAGVNTIPHAFVVDRAGKVVWHGMPLDGLDEVVAAVLDDTFDPARASRADKAERLLALHAELTGSLDEPELANAVLERVLSLADTPKLKANVAAALLAADAPASATLARAVALAGEAHGATGGEDPAVLDVYARALAAQGKLAEAVKAQRAAIDRTDNIDIKWQMAKRLRDLEKKAAQAN